MRASRKRCALMSLLGVVRDPHDGTGGRHGLEDELLDADLISRYVRAHSERRPRHVDLVRWRAFKHYYIAFSPRAQAEVAAWIRAADKRHAVSR